MGVAADTHWASLTISFAGTARAQLDLEGAGLFQGKQLRQWQLPWNVR